MTKVKTCFTRTRRIWEMQLHSWRAFTRYGAPLNYVIKISTASNEVHPSLAMAHDRKASSSACLPSTANETDGAPAGGLLPSLSSGNISLSTPIGYIKSCFKSKNGTPRQPTVCSYSRARLRILKSVFVCPDHSLDGLADFSHVWILFVFHQNSQEKFTKAKVKPPRLDGRKVGVFASRTPHRPNPVGLTLARLDKVEGDTIYLSGMDMIDGTPVLDIKPYVPAYDCPRQTSAGTIKGENPSSSKESQIFLESRLNTGWISRENIDGSGSEWRAENEDQTLLNRTKREGPDTGSSAVEGIHSYQSNSEVSASEDADDGVKVTEMELHPSSNSENSVAGQQRGTSRSDERQDWERITSIHVGSSENVVHAGSDKRANSARTAADEMAGVGQRVDAGGSDVKVADWVSAPPIQRLLVRFTPSAEGQLAAFWHDQNQESDDYKLDFLRDANEARGAIEDILSADPRSVYRRKDCSDRLYFFTLDNLHITSWFGTRFAEVIHVQPISQASVPGRNDHSPSKKPRTVKGP